MVALGAAGCSDDSHPNPGGTSSQTALKPVAVEVQEAVAKVWPDAPQIWPGTVLKDRKIILGDRGRARLISVDGVTDLSPAELAKKKIAIPRGGSSYATWDGHPAVVMNVSDPSYRSDAEMAGQSLSTTLFAAATDELYHATEQKWKAWKKGGELRGTEYPLAVMPRLYRAMLYNDLVAAYRDPRQRNQRLAGAAYWRSKWQKEFPDEAKRAAATDVGEGAAGYFDAVATAMAAGAGRGDQAEIRKRSQFRPLDQAIDPGQVTLDAESTALGGIAGLLLDETRKGWKQEVSRGRRTPVDLLLAGVSPVAEPPSDPLRRSIQDILSKLNTDLIPRLNPLVSAYHDKARPLLLIPMSAAEGDLDAGGYYVSHGVPYAILARLNGTFRLSGGTIEAKEASVLAGQIGGHPYLIVPMGAAGDKSTVASNRVQLSSGTLTGSSQVATRRTGGREEYVAR
ncbi:hypothetical protein GCM10023196_049110 [Actinoallomurus vinaceus]|uniref:Lipoprotein n=1 Tax=Actinoallomurus vinaceus TaxID=1080074 RepID=A0ABP8UD02_9ACTN